MRRDVADGAVQSGVVILVDPLQCFLLDLPDRFPRAEEVDHPGLEQADDAFGKSIVIGLPHTADRGVDPRLRQPLGVSGRQLLGGFKRSLQRFQIGGCDDKPQTRLGAQYTN